MLLFGDNVRLGMLPVVLNCYCINETPQQIVQIKEYPRRILAYPLIILVVKYTFQLVILSFVVSWNFLALLKQGLILGSLGNLVTLKTFLVKCLY